MSFNDMLSDFQTILNRDDCSAAQAQTFLLQGVRRVQRECRLPSMERQQVTTAALAMAWVPIPQDLLQIIDVVYSGSWTQGFPRPLKFKPFRDLVQMCPTGDVTHYSRFQSQLFFGGNVPQGDTVNVLYFGQFTPWATADSENELSASCPDLAVYAGLPYAADYFEHPSGPAWTARYQEIKAEVMGEVIDLEWNGGGLQQTPYGGAWE